MGPRLRLATARGPGEQDEFAARNSRAVMGSDWEAYALASPNDAAAMIQKVLKNLVKPHSGGQDLVAASKARFRIIRAGRRWGKTKASAREVVIKAMESDQMIFWVANSFKNVKRGYREIVRQLPRELLAKAAPPSTSNELVLNLKNGTVIEFYSGGNPDAMAGEGVDFIVIDEAALIPGDVWYQTVRPMLLDTGGSALLISTPRGRNWFYKLWEMGQDDRLPNYESWHFPSAASPYLPDAEIEEMRLTMPERLFNQEVLALWIANAASLINMEKVVQVSEYAEPQGTLVMGVDLAKSEDFSVIDVAREDRLPVYFDRFKDISWPDQKERIMEAADMFLALPKVEHVVIGVDATGLGDVVVDDLDLAGYDVEPVQFSPAKKPLYVRRLAADLENQQAFIHEDQADEFEAYEYHLTPAGNLVYEAGEGSHDDKVAAKMIQHWVLTHRMAGEVHVESAAFHDEEQDSGETVELVPDSTAEIMQRDEAWSRF